MLYEVITACTAMAMTFTALPSSAAPRWNSLSHWIGNRTSFMPMIGIRVITSYSIHYTKLYEELIGLKIDCNAQKYTEQALRESQDQLQSFFEAAPLGLVVSQHKKMLKVNRKFCEITGYTSKELVHKSSRCFYQNDQEFDRVSQELTRSMWEKGEVGYSEASCICKDGSVRDMALYAAPIDGHNPAAGAA